MNIKPWNTLTGEEFKAMANEEDMAKALGLSEKDIPKASLCIYLTQKVFSNNRLPYIFVVTWLNLLNQDITDNVKLAEYFFDSLTNDQLIAIAYVIVKLEPELDDILMTLAINLAGRNDDAK